MKTIIKALWTEPVVVGLTVLAAVNAALLVPDWRSALGSVAASIAAAIGIRSTTTPKAPSA